MVVLKLVSPCAGNHTHVHSPIRTHVLRHTRDIIVHYTHHAWQLVGVCLPLGYWLSVPRVEANSGLDFLEVVVSMLENGVLVDGDFLVLDNAKIHFSEDIQDILNPLLVLSGVRLVFLPTYCPEVRHISFDNDWFCVTQMHVCTLVQSL